MKDQVVYYIRNWKWFVVSILAVVLAAYLYVRYSVPQYSATSILMIKDDKKGGVDSEQTAFSDLAVLSSVKSNLDNEIEVIKSLTIVKAAVKDLGLNVTYVNEGRVKSEEMYNKAPINFMFVTQQPGSENRTINYRLSSASDNQFTLFDSVGGKLGVFYYGETIRLPEGEAVVLARNDKKNFVKRPYKISVIVRTVADVAGSYKGRLNIKKVGDRTSIVELSIVDPIPQRAEDFLNALIRVYNEDVVADKNRVFENTSKFISERLKLIEGDLGDVERDAETFKRTNHVTDITSEANLFLANASEFERKEIETDTQLKIVATMADYVNSSRNNELIPANILTSDANASGLIDQYNQMVLERNRLLKSAGPKNAVVKTLDGKIESLKQNIESSLSRLNTSLEIKKKDLAYQNALFNGKISRIPTLEREAKILGRQQQIKESLYLYLLQKREETAISLAVTAPNAKVIDPALSSRAPISPVKGTIYLSAFGIALLLPFGILYLLNMLDNKVKARQDVESKLSIPFLGDIPTSNASEAIINASNRSSTAEAIRIVNTNLEFMLNQVPDEMAKTVFVTSTIPKEGKTFLSVNLASTIALSGKKVLLIGMDIRNPKIDGYLDLPKEGVTNYLSTKDADLFSFIHKIPNFSELYVLPSGVIPPNPAELLMSQKVNEMFTKLKQEFDYIVVDTSPVHLVTDTLLMAHHADSVVYVVRANYMDKDLLRVPHQLHTEKKMPNIGIVLNDTEVKKGYGYGYGAYGYGYGYEREEEKMPLYRQLLNKIKATV
ncbi:hypothetical protein Q767_00820 [Flavobacterium enshiense DK69]|uniref:non-specific protein-tyrosine kinase n=1 Tax=Flavobacterium enshiense DK69 TaxID=1107311 RepID=A0A0A2N9T9_9FLAO|nr:hypothetical protein Q767_00820 [Flavobacterium enshiense DK69]